MLLGWLAFALMACSRLRSVEGPLGRLPADALKYDGPGEDRLGVSLLDLLPERTIGKVAPIEGHVTLVRWWTDGCPFCERSLPAIESLRREHAGAGFETLAVYHPKPARHVEDGEVREMAARIGYHGALSIDERWESLKQIWLDTGEREATSVSFLLDREGRVRFVHPGPELHPSSDPEHAACDADYRRLAAAIRALLAE